MSPRAGGSPKSSRHGSRRGQALVEFTLILPIILVLVMSMAEIGLAVGNNMSLELATREGARVGASLAAGGTHPETVDPQIIASVERALRSPGSGVDITKIDYIHIYLANAAGGETSYNEWLPGAGPTVDGVTLHFYQASVGWTAASRSSALPAQSLGVSIKYRYRLITPLAVMTGLFGLNEIAMTDATVMALEPTG